ncbi:galactose-3-O-sulfotransferase 4-like [Spea bombifrons]|uniref:galactose-3-O-sulfotransferase 4-like n=1 Tax=Spea bombifrons TaxID=233779 RepID=UPI00234AC2A0|nr:galactose-3-O-sulfotransferase 4-like [Spea bombifrons]
MTAQDTQGEHFGVTHKRDISTELLLCLKNMDISDKTPKPLCKELLKQIEKLKLKVDISKSNSIKNIEKKRSSCQPKTRIFFLKTHKTASSTIMNILFRFGDSRNLTFAFPSKNATQFYYPGFFSASQVDNFSDYNNNTFHIMCHHMRFRLTEVEKVMPSDTFYFTILRNPIYLMESSFSYYKSTSSFAKAKSLEDFLNNTTKYYSKSNYAKNLMTFDLGFDHNGLESAKYFKLMQEAVEIIFDLVLITEYFDESLVLLKDALCWTYEDLLSFPLNSRSDITKKALPLETQERIKAWNQHDWKLYNYFNRTFWNRVEKFGIERMKREVEELRQQRAQLSKTCLQGKVEAKEIKDKSLKPFQYGMAKIIGYNLKPGLGMEQKILCQRLVTPELQYSDLLRKKQRQKNEHVHVLKHNKVKNKNKKVKPK